MADFVICPGTLNLMLTQRPESFRERKLKLFLFLFPFSASNTSSLFFTLKDATCYLIKLT